MAHSVLGDWQPSNHGMTVDSQEPRLSAPIDIPAFSLFRNFNFFSIVHSTRGIFRNRMDVKHFRRLAACRIPRPPRFIFYLWRSSIYDRSNLLYERFDFLPLSVSLTTVRSMSDLSLSRPFHPRFILFLSEKVNAPKRRTTCFHRRYRSTRISIFF